MRLYEIVLRSGGKAEVAAEVLHDPGGEEERIYFYRDKGLKHLVAYFNKEEVAGIVFGPDNATGLPRSK